MAEAAAAEVWDHEVEGATKCQAPGCPNWFIKAGNRHRYCKGPNCTYRRGAPTPREVEAPEGAAQELLLRLQDEDSGEVGPQMLAHRRKAVQDALRAGDKQALTGALIDEATCCIWFADRTAINGLPQQAAPVVPGAPVSTQHIPSTKPVGLVQAVIASHRRTFDLAEHRMNAMWKMLQAREQLASAELGVEQMAGGPKEAEAREVRDASKAEFDAAERAYEAVESAWRERTITIRDLTVAAASIGGGPARAAAA
jgi:hypothetical protein